MQTQDLYLADASVVLINIEQVLDKIGYPNDPGLRRVVRNYCVVRAIEEIILVHSCERVAYLEHAYHLVKNTYVVDRHGFTVGLLEDVNLFCLQRLQSTTFAFEANLHIRGRWLVAGINNPEVERHYLCV